MDADTAADRVVVARAPGRVNLIGEHLDYNGGLCLPVALPLTTTAAARQLPGRAVSLRSGVLTWEGTLDDGPSGWPSYVVGVLTALGVDRGVAIELTSDVPVGAGLSSSAALECSVALAVDGLLGLGADRERLLAACIEAENVHVGVPSGGMDQAAALFAVPGSALLLDFATDARTWIPFDPEASGLALLVLDTGVSHRLSDGSYGDRTAECRQAADQLGTVHLARATYEDLPRLSTDLLRRRARHVVTEQQRVLAFVAACQDRAWSEVGALMTASHLSLRDDFEVSCAELDLVVATALSAGALGARMTGGGFGGSAIVLCRAEQTAAVTSRITTAFVRNGQDAPTCFQVEASGAAVVVG